MLLKYDEKSNTIILILFKIILLQIKKYAFNKKIFTFHYQESILFAFLKSSLCI